MNRFSTDLHRTDTLLPDTLYQFLDNVFVLVSAVVLASSLAPIAHVYVCTMPRLSLLRGGIRCGCDWNASKIGADTATVLMHAQRQKLHPVLVN